MVVIDILNITLIINGPSDCSAAHLFCLDPLSFSFQLKCRIVVIGDQCGSFSVVTHFSAKS